ncbi:MAG: hypothetical protein ABIQ18_06615 [Umezawaea sp.]
MAAPAIPPIRLGLIGTGLATSTPEIPAPPEPLWRPRGSTSLFEVLRGQRISRSASFAA